MFKQFSQTPQEKKQVQEKFLEALKQNKQEQKKQANQQAKPQSSKNK